MNKDFFRATLLLVFAVIFIGIIAYIIPEYPNDIFAIKKMKWFDIFRKEEVIIDSTASSYTLVEHEHRELKPFYNKLNALKRANESDSVFGKKNNIRIAYFGDSLIEGDLITAPLRQAFQEEYGGNGVGFVPITSIVSGFRQTIRHEFSKNWESISFMNFDKPNVSLGITGYTFIPRNYYTLAQKVETVPLDTLIAVVDSALVKEQEKEQKKSVRVYVDYNPWVEYKAVNTAGGAPNFKKIRLFYSMASYGSVVHYQYDGGTMQTARLSEGEALQVLDLSPSGPIRTLRLEFEADDPIYVYGVSFDDDTGVYVDNFPVRGYSGAYFQRIFSHILKGFQKALDYDLIVLHYGGNVSNPNVRNYDNYKTMMVKTVNYLQSAMPSVPILIVGMHDRSIKEGGSYQTSPDVPYLIKAQNEVATETGAGFWNLFQAMGGFGSMIDYVNQNPPLASKDYTHFTRRGADKVAEMLLDFLKYR